MNGRLECVQASPEALEEVDGCGQATQAVFAQPTPQELPHANGFVALRRRGRETARNRLKESLEPSRLDAPENLLPEHEVAQRADYLWRDHIVDDLLEDFVAGPDSARDRIQEVAVVESLH